ncbi:MAG: HTTM domain-containing protein [Planctomycetota bacterium]
MDSRSEVLWQATIGWLKNWRGRWDRFWFAPERPHGLAVMRAATGAMLAYVHIIWFSRQSDFFGANAWIDREASRQLHEYDAAWSWLWYTESSALISIHLVIAIVASLCVMVGLMTRIALPVVWLLTLMVCHRQTLALFGLDQIVMLLAMYLSLARSGSVLSVDARLRGRFGESWLLPNSRPAEFNRIAMRLIQLHLCVIYIFGGLSKMRGEMWYDGSAMWFALVNYEYQSMDLTWLGKSPLVISTLSAVTLFWETFYVALVWPKVTRPIAVGLAFFMHAGIAIGLGMITFGTIMIVANLAFVSPRLWESLIEPRAKT